LFVSAGNLRVTLEAARADHTINPAPVHRVITGRLIMPTAAAEVMGRTILNFFQQNTHLSTTSQAASPPQTRGSHIGEQDPATDRTIPTRYDDPAAPELYVDGLSGLALSGGNVHLTFEVARADHNSNPAPILRVIVGRVVMPTATAEAMAQTVVDFLDRVSMPAASAPSTRTLQ
jgi:hypothetical protein